MKIVLMIQARSGSKRLPRKAFLPIGPFSSMLSSIYNQVSKSKKVDEYFLGTSDSHDEYELKELAKSLGLKVSIGPVDNIVQRLYNLVEDSQADVVIRVWGDCPFVCPDIIDQMLEDFSKKKLEFFTNSDFFERTTPPGIDLEIYSKDLIARMNNEIQILEEREFPVEFVKRTPGISYGFWNIQPSRSHIHLTIDYDQDLLAGSKILTTLLEDKTSFTSSDLFQLMDKDESLFNNFSKSQRNIEYSRFLAEKDLKT